MRYQEAYELIQVSLDSQGLVQFPSSEKLKSEFFDNTGKDIVLKHYTSHVYDKVEAHTMEYSSDGTAKMLQKESLTVPANGEIKSKSGGLHLMLMGKRRELVLDENIMIVTYDENEVRYMLNLKVIDPRSHNNHDHHMH